MVHVRASNLSARIPRKNVSNQSVSPFVLYYMRRYQEDITGWLKQRVNLTSVRVAIIGVIVCLGIRTVALPIVLSGHSMAPCIWPGQVGMVNRFAYRGTSPRRGDIVVARTPATKGLVLKRIVGLPHEEVKMIWGCIYIDGKKLDEPYVRESGGWTMLPVTLGDGEYWVIGDNRQISDYARVQQSELVGKASMARGFMVPTDPFRLGENHRDDPNSIEST